MRCFAQTFVLGAAVWLAWLGASAQSTVSMRIVMAQSKHAAPPLNAVLWLEPVSADVSRIDWPARPPYRLVQKSRTFSPHVLVVPVGASVAFPNADPYFHNVFSLFEGSRFDLGLYEAGSTRNVRFSRKGISYIFCNIHPEMGAVVLSLDTPLWVMSKPPSDELTLHNVPKGTYDATLWVEGQPQALLSQWKHRIIVPSDGTVDAGEFHSATEKPAPHSDKFGQPYKKDTTPY